jgi:hypothetical protein
VRNRLIFTNSENFLRIVVVEINHGETMVGLFPPLQLRRLPTAAPDAMRNAAYHRSEHLVFFRSALAFGRDDGGR